MDVLMGHKQNGVQIRRLWTENDPFCTGSVYEISTEAVFGRAPDRDPQTTYDHHSFFPMLGHVYTVTVSRQYHHGARLPVHGRPYLTRSQFHHTRSKVAGGHTRVAETTLRYTPWEGNLSYWSETFTATREPAMPV